MGQELGVEPRFWEIREAARTKSGFSDKLPAILHHPGICHIIPVLPKFGIPPDCNLATVQRVEPNPTLFVLFQVAKFQSVHRLCWTTSGLDPGPSSHKLLP